METCFFTSHDGSQIAYDLIAGEAPKQLLILINGFQRTRQDFRAFRNRIAKLNPGIATLALDNRGCGETQSQDVTLQNMVSDAKALAEAECRKLNLPAYTALGISMGGMIAQRLAANNETMDKLVLVSTTGGGTLQVMADPELQAIYNNFPRDEDGTREKMKYHFGPKFLNNSKMLFEIFVKNMIQKGKTDESRAQASAQREATRGFEGIHFHNQISQDTLIVTGDSDHIFPLQNAYNLKNSIPTSQVIVYKEVGHLILIEEPELFAKDVSHFLGD